jgi:cytochrome c peroxidase
MKPRAFALLLSITSTLWLTAVVWAGSRSTDDDLAALLAEHDFTGGIEARFREKLDQRLADIGRLLWFDTIGGLNDDNSCGGCHSPTHAFGDAQPIAIGIDNNLIVGPGRTGPRTSGARPRRSMPRSFQH